MKTAQSWVKEWFENSDESISKFIKRIQKEAWNEAVEDVAEHAKTKDIVERQNPMSIHQIIDKESILKRKK